MLSYRVKVLPIKNGTPLFGGRGVIEPVRSSMMLLVQTDRNAVPIDLTIRTVLGGNDVKLGRLEPGETYAVPLSQVFHISAESAEDTHVNCTILIPEKSMP